jgi:hypothetical protein
MLRPFSLYLAASVDVFHALVMVAWIAGVPLLFWHRWPRLSRWYAGYSVVVIVVSQLSHFALGECILTTLARHLWLYGSPHPELVARTWFTVRLVDAIFQVRPSERAVIIAWEGLILVGCIGLLVHLRRSRRLARRPLRAPS